MTPELSQAVAQAFPYVAYGTMGIIAFGSSRMIASAIDHRRAFRETHEGIIECRGLGSGRGYSRGELKQIAMEARWLPSKLFHLMESLEHLAAIMGLVFTTGGLLVLSIHSDGSQSFIQTLGAAVGTTMIGTFVSGVSSLFRKSASFHQGQLMALLGEIGASGAEPPKSSEQEAMA